MGGLGRGVGVEWEVKGTKEMGSRLSLVMKLKSRKSVMFQKCGYAAMTGLGGVGLGLWRP